jgi:hypothetical protein
VSRMLDIYANPLPPEEDPDSKEYALAEQEEQLRRWLDGDIGYAEYVAWVYENPGPVPDSEVPSDRQEGGEG